MSTSSEHLLWQLAHSRSPAGSVSTAVPRVNANSLRSMARARNQAIRQSIAQRTREPVMGPNERSELRNLRSALQAAQHGESQGSASERLANHLLTLHGELIGLTASMFDAVSEAVRRNGAYLLDEGSADTCQCCTDPSGNVIYCTACCGGAGEGASGTSSISPDDPASAEPPACFGGDPAAQGGTAFGTDWVTQMHDQSLRIIEFPKHQTLGDQRLMHPNGASTNPTCKGAFRPVYEYRSHRGCAAVELRWEIHNFNVDPCLEEATEILGTPFGVDLEPFAENPTDFLDYVSRYLFGLSAYLERLTAYRDALSRDAVRASSVHESAGRNVAMLTQMIDDMTQVEDGEMAAVLAEDNRAFQRLDNLPYTSVVAPSVSQRYRVDNF